MRPEIVLQSYLDCHPVSDDEFLRFWNSLSEMEKEYYLRADLPASYFLTSNAH